MCFLCVFCVCFLSVFSVCVFMLCFLLCVFSSLCFFLSSLCFQYVLSVCVFCPCFLSGFAFLSINFDIILLWSGLADQLLFADINSQFIWLQYKYKILTRYFGLSGSPASSFYFLFIPFSCYVNQGRLDLCPWQSHQTGKVDPTPSQPTPHLWPAPESVEGSLENKIMTMAVICDIVYWI